MSPRPVSSEVNPMTSLTPAEFVHYVRNVLRREGRQGPRYFNPIGIDYNNRFYYENLPPATADKLRGLITLEFAALLQIAKQFPLVYAKGAITGGAYALREAIEKGAPTLHKLDEHIGTPRSRKHITRPNTRTNQIIGGILQKQYPGHGIAAPTAREMSAKKAMQHPAFGGLQFQDVDFMALWYLLQMHFEQVAPFVADWNASRNTNNEASMETMIEAGLVPARSAASIKPVDANGEPFTLGMRMEKHAQMIRLSLAHGIDCREAAQAFCIAATLDQWRRLHDPRAANMSRSLKNPSAKELALIDALRAEMDPLITTYAAAHLRPADLLPLYQTAWKEAQGAEPAVMAAERQDRLKTEAARYLDTIEDVTSFTMEPDLLRHFQKMPTPSQRRFDPQSEIFDPKQKSLFFHDDHHYKACSEWEQALLPFAIWAMEIVLLPYNNPRAAVVFDDHKRGAVAEKYRQKHNLVHIDEALPHAGAKAEELILTPAQNAMRQRLHKIRQARPGKAIIGPAEFQFIFGVLEELRATIPDFCGKGPNKTSPAFRYLFKKAFMERNADEAFFPPRWELSPELVQLRNATRNIQCEFIERPIDGPVDFHVYTAPAQQAEKPAWRDTPDSLTADAAALTEVFREHAARMTKAPEQGLALARLWVRNQLIRPEISGLVDEEMLRTAYASSDILIFNKQTMDQVLSDAVALLKKHAHLWPVPASRLLVQPDPADGPQRQSAVKLEHRLMKSFADAQAQAVRAEELAKAQRPTSEKHVHAGAPQR